MEAPQQAVRRHGRVATMPAGIAVRRDVPVPVTSPPAMVAAQADASNGVRKVSFAPPERIAIDGGGEGAVPGRFRSASDGAWVQLGSTAGLEATDAFGGMRSSGGATQVAMSTPSSMTRTVTLVSPATGSPQGMSPGTQSMPVTMQLRPSQGAAAVGSVAVRSFGSGLGDQLGSVAVRSYGSGMGAQLGSEALRSAMGDQFMFAGARSLPVDGTERYLGTVPKAQTISEPAAAASVSGQGAAERRKRHAKTVNLGALPSPELKVGVIAPGGGTVMNGAVYAKLGQRDGIALEILGQSRSPYDRYTEAWGPPSGGPPPNLESFAMELVGQGVMEKFDCLVVGSRGGQVCLPTFWRLRGAEVPPAVVMNGGCGMQLPIQVPWPDSAVTFLLIGGQDYFRQQFTLDQYLKDAQSRVPHNNVTTAIMLVHEMAHMPQMQLLDAILLSMIKVVTAWKEDRETIPTTELEKIVAAVSALGFHGALVYKTGLGDVWSVTNIPDAAARPMPVAQSTAAGGAATRSMMVVGRAAPLYND